MQDKKAGLGSLFRGAAKSISGLGHKGTRAAFGKAREAGAGTLKGKAYTVAGKASDIARKHPGKVMAGAAGLGAGAMLSGKEKRAEDNQAAEMITREAKAEGEDPQVEAAEKAIKDKNLKVNEVLPSVEKDKRDDVLKELREDKEEKTASHYPNAIEKTASVETKIGEGIGWQ